MTRLRPTRPLPGLDDDEDEPFVTSRPGAVRYQFSIHEEEILRLLIAERLRAIEEGTAAYATPLSAYLNVPQLRAFWPLSSVDHNGDLYDLSGQGRSLANIGGAAFGLQGVTPTVDLDGSSQYLSQADSAGTSIAGPLSLGAWFYVESGFTDCLLIGKMGGRGDYGYALVVEDAGGSPRVSTMISTDGNSLHTAGLAPVPATFLDRWNFIAGTYDPAGAVTLYVNSDTPATVGSGLGALYDNAMGLSIGHGSYPPGYLAGRVAFPFLAAAALSAATMSDLFQATRAIFGR